MGSNTASFVGGNPAYALVAAERQNYPEWGSPRRMAAREVLVSLSGADPALDARSHRKGAEELAMVGAPPPGRVRPRQPQAAECRANSQRMSRMSEVGRALDLPLAVLIEIADIHLTEGSSSAIEARGAPA